jgi:F0F1-type ATP synthase delta subunit
LTDDERKKVTTDVIKKLGSDAKVRFNVDPAILGGLIVRVGDKVIDGSVANQVQNLRQSLH